MRIKTSRVWAAVRVPQMERHPFLIAIMVVVLNLFQLYHARKRFSMLLRLRQARDAVLVRDKIFKATQRGLPLRCCTVLWQLGVM